VRSAWSLLASVVVLGGLVGYIYFVDSKTEPNAPEVKEKVWAGTLASADMEEVEIKLAAGDTAKVQKIDGTWQLVEPAKAPADDMEMTSITSSLAGLEIQRVVDANAGDVKKYGLDPARISVAFRSKGQKDPRRIEFGEKTPTGGDLYARIPGDKRVFLVSSFLDSTFNKTPFALRDKVILKIDRQKADGLELAEGTTNVQLSKKGSDWMIVKPLATRADFAVVESSLERVGSAQMVGIIEENATNLGKYGLENSKSDLEMTPEALDLLTAYGWPGNIRELRNTVERMAILSPEDRITMDSVPLEIHTPPSSRSSGLHEVRDSAERDRIRQALEQTDWNVAGAARVLGIERTNLHKRMKALGLNRE